MSAGPIAIVGAGTMGHGIAYVALLAGLTVRLADASESALATARERVDASFARAVERGKATVAQREEALRRLTTHAGAADAVRDAAVVIEAVPERLELKRALLAEIERNAPAEALLATNTSSLSIDAIADALREPGRLAGMHFFNPVAVMRLVEVVQGVRTTPAALAGARALAES